MIFITIDGDDIGRKISACYLSNNSVELRLLSNVLDRTTKEISELLLAKGYEIIFCGADGVAASIQNEDTDLDKMFNEIRSISPIGITFSAGAGSNLMEAYIALMSAKCNGKNRLHYYSDIAL